MLAGHLGHQLHAVELGTETFEGAAKLVLASRLAFPRELNQDLDLFQRLPQLGRPLHRLLELGPFTHHRTGLLLIRPDVRVLCLVVDHGEVALERVLVKDTP